MFPSRFVDIICQAACIISVTGQRTSLLCISNSSCLTRYVPSVHCFVERKLNYIKQVSSHGGKVFTRRSQKKRVHTKGVRGGSNLLLFEGIVALDGACLNCLPGLILPFSISWSFASYLLCCRKDILALLMVSELPDLAICWLSSVFDRQCP